MGTGVGIDDSFVAPMAYRNTNTVWAAVLVETLYRLGLKTAVICPGSRSAPLAIAFAAHPGVEAIPVLDERSASFFALGLARRSGVLTVLVCTSGTAGANFYPAVIEAHESQVPLLVLTADRPPELRQCHAGQAIDQVKLYGGYPNWQAELAVPSVEPDLLAYVRQTLVYAWERTQWPTAGPVHLNVPFREPLTPILDPAIAAQMENFKPEIFFSGLQSPETDAAAIHNSNFQHSNFQHANFQHANFKEATLLAALQHWQPCRRGLIIAGLAQPGDPEVYCRAIGRLAEVLQWPVLADGLSPLRNFRAYCPALITTYDWLLRDPVWRSTVIPDCGVQIGELPTSKELRTWLAESQPQRWIVDASDHNLDPLHGPTQHLRLSVEQLSEILTTYWDSDSKLEHSKLEHSKHTGKSIDCTYLENWTHADRQARQHLDATLATLPDLFEGKVAWLLAQTLPIGTPLFIANSTPVRDVEWFWPPGDRQIRPFFNRGANGIDGILSTACGIAHRGQPSVLLTGDLALLHDTNGLLLRKNLVGHLTIVLINNNGGGIFELLPIAQFEPPFTDFFATPQNIDFAQLCKTYGIEHITITNWEQFQTLLNPLPTTGIRVLEVQSDRRADAHWRKQLFATPVSSLQNSPSPPSPP
ncbi:2-succinyl-5-enolpyruvyl-6-hydroxy-3-cyclohexene-1-carboxylic-acid synthase [Trichothermofontia sp.]